MADARKQYDALPWYAKIPQAADDVVRLVANGITLGGADKLAGGDAEARTAAALDRAGIAGDVAGYVGGAKAILKGVPLAWQGAKALPKLVKGAVSAKGLGALGIGALAFSDYNRRTGGGSAQAAPAAPKAAAPKAAAKPRTAAGADRATDAIMTSLGLSGPGNNALPTFQDMASQISAAQGGISLRQLGALSEVAQRSAVKPVKPVNPAFETQQRLQAYYGGLRDQEIASGVSQADADANWAAKMEGLMKLSASDQLIRNSMPRFDDEEW